MTNQDETAALADELRSAVSIGATLTSIKRTCAKAADVLDRLAATSPGDAVREVLRAHWLHQIVCNHEDGTDKPCCSCSMWNCPPQPSIGAAVEAWIDHVIDHLTKAHVENAALPGHDWQLSDETKADLKAIGDHQRASAATVSTMICGSAALAPAEKAGDDDLYVIRKRGYFYRPNAQGYTTDIRDAGRYTKEEADDHARSCKELTVRPVSDYLKAATPTPPSADVPLEAVFAAIKDNVYATIDETVGGIADAAADVMAVIKSAAVPPSADVEELARLKQGIRDIAQACVEGRVCDDIAWFTAIPSETLFEKCCNLLDEDLPMDQSAAHGGGTKSKCDCGPTCKDVGPECRYIKSDGACLSSLPSGESEPLVTTASAPSDTVECPDCGGCGSRMISVAGCCENPTRTGECCGNAIEVPGYEECSSCGGSGSVAAPSDPAQEPQAVAFVPVHPKQGPLWTETYPADRDVSQSRSQSYERMALYTRPVSLDREAVYFAVEAANRKYWDTSAANGDAQDKWRAAGNRGTAPNIVQQGSIVNVMTDAIVALIEGAKP